MRRSLAALLIVLLPMTLAGVALANHAGPLEGQWHLDASSGGQTDDSSGHNLDANVQGSLVDDGRFAKALGLASVGDGFSVDDGTGLLRPGTALTVAAWVRATAPGAGRAIAVDSPDGCTEFNGYILRTTSTQGLEFAMSFHRSSGPADYATVTTPAVGSAAVFDGDWHAIAGVYTASGRISLWVDGVRTGVAAVPPEDSAPAYDLGDQKFYVGHRAACANTEFAGAVDEVRVYGKALHGYEIRKLQDPQATTPPDLPATPPENVTPPRLSGGKLVGSKLHCTGGTYDQSPEGGQPLSYIWERAPEGTLDDEEDPGWKTIDGAGGTQAQGGTDYTTQHADVGSLVRCREIFSASSGSAEAVSNAFLIEAGVPFNVQQPEVSGLARTGLGLKCNPGTWINNARTFRYQWLREGKPISGATRKSYTLRRTRLKGKVVNSNGDGDHFISCRVTALNGAGPSAPATSKHVLAIDGTPYPKGRQQAVLFPPPNPSDHEPLHSVGICFESAWYDDYARKVGAPWHYEYQWARNGVAIPGATDRVYHPTVDDLGRDLSCQVTVSNPLGQQTAYSTSDTLHLPEGKPDVHVYKESTGNPADPTNLLAISDDYADKIRGVVIKRLKKGIAKRTDECRDRGGVPAGPPPDRTAVTDATMTDVTICRILLHDSDHVQPYFDGGVRYRTGKCNVAPEFASKEFPLCPSLRIEVPSIDPLRPPQSDPDLLKDIDEISPRVVLWDLDQDGKTDAACPGSAPVLRSIYDQENWHAHVVIVDQDNTYHEGSIDFDYTPDGSPKVKGSLRDAQVKVCSTSFDPPPVPSLPCITHGEIGRAQISGNLCPINARAITKDDFNGLFDGDVQQFLINAAEQDLANQGQPTSKASLHEQPGNAHTDWVPWERPPGVERALIQSKDVAGALDSTIAAVTAYKSPDTLSRGELSDVYHHLGADIVNFHPDLAQFATDQIYVGRVDKDHPEPMKVNGVSIDTPPEVLSFLVPSDVHRALNQVKSMTLASRNAASRFGPPGAQGIPLTDPREIKAVIPDAPTEEDAFLFGKKQASNINLDDLKNKANDLDFGPFKLAGSADVKLEKDGTATLHAYAELPRFTAEPPGPKPPPKTRVDIFLKGDLQGRLSLQGIHLGPIGAYLGAVQLKNLGLDYDHAKGLDVHGLIWLPPPVGAGLDIKHFSFGPTGAFQGIDVDFNAGAATSIPIAPGAYLTSLNFHLDEPADLVGGGGAVSIGPSPGGGCPAAGMTARFTAHVATPVYLSATGQIVVACIPFVNMNFYADETGDVHATAKVDFDKGPVHAHGSLGAAFNIPDWQLTMHGQGGIDHVLTGGVDAALSNRGFAACGNLTVEVPVASQISKLLGGHTVTATVRAGGSVDFPGGVPPITTPQLIEAIHVVLDGCDVGDYKPLGDRTSLHAASVGETTFSIKRGTGPSFISLEGAGAAPHVRLRAPSGKLFDWSDAGGLRGKYIGNNWGTILEKEDRTVVLLSKPEAGTWTVQSVGGTPRVVRVRRAGVLPPPAIKGSVTGKGAHRVIHYDAYPEPGQSIRFSEVAGRSHHLIKTVKGGGRGKIRFTISESRRRQRTIEADVMRDGITRKIFTLAHFRATSPRVGKPKHVRVRRNGRTAVATWGAAPFAKTYDVSVTYGVGRYIPLFPKGGARSVKIPNVRKGEGLRVKVVGVSLAGRRGPAAIGKLKGSMHVGSHKHKHHHKKHGHGKGKVLPAR